MNNITFKVTTKAPTPPVGSVWERENFKGKESGIEYPVCKLGSHYDFSHWSQNFTLFRTKTLTGVCFRIESKGNVTKPLKVGISNKLMNDPNNPTEPWLAYGELGPINGLRYVSCIFDEPISVIPPPQGMYYITLFSDEVHDYENSWYFPTQGNIPDVLYTYNGRVKKWRSTGVDMYYGKFKKK
jgi:hypothetical protein